MFKLDYEEYGKIQKPIYCNDINTLADILCGLVNDERTERETIAWCRNAEFGTHFVNQKYRFELTCMYDERNIVPPINIIDIEDNNVVQIIVDRISKETGLKNVKETNNRWVFKLLDTYNILFFVDKVLELRIVINGEIKYKEKSAPKNKLTKENLDKYIVRCVNILNNYKRIVSKNINSTELMQRVHKLERTRCIRNNELVEILKDAEALQMELRIRIYRQECWEVYVERHPYGNIRYWVKRETKLGEKDIKQVYINSDGKGYTCDIKIKAVVVDKIMTSYKTLKEMDLIK